VADVLDTGPPRRPVRSRRWVTTAGAVALAGVAALLAARSTTPDRPTPTPAAATTAAAARPTGPVLVSLALGTTSAYALAADCDTPTFPVCRYQLHRRTDGRWEPLPWRVGPRRGVGLAPAVTVSGPPGAEVVTVVTSIDPPQVYTSTDGGRTVTAHRLGTGPPIAAVPPTGVLDPGYCAGCADRIGVLDPATGRTRPLAAQPPLGTARLRSFDRVGDVVWAVGADPRATVSAVSTDAGRTWRAVPVPGRPAPNQLLRVLAGADGSAWLVSGSYLGGPPQQFSGVRRIDGPGGAWRELPARPGPRTMQDALAGARGLLLGEVNGTPWRVPPGGGFQRLADPGLLRPAELVRGPGGRVASLSPDDANGRTVLLSDDEGGSWRAERVF
jgi:hypothetical protein